MKNFVRGAVCVLLSGVSFSLFSQNIGINTTGATPSPNAILDLNTGNAKNVGLLIPRVVLGSSLSTFSPPMANSPSGKDSGMMVYNWQSTHQPVGYYYWTGSVWASVAVSSSTVIYAVQDNTSTSGTVTSNGSPILNLTGNAPSLTVVPPSSPVNGQLWEVTTNQNNIHITWSGSFVNSPGAVKSDTPAKFYYDSSISEWMNM